MLFSKTVFLPNPFKIYTSLITKAFTIKLSLIYVLKQFKFKAQFSEYGCTIKQNSRLQYEFILNNKSPIEIITIIWLIILTPSQMQAKLLSPETTQLIRNKSNKECKMSTFTQFKFFSSQILYDQAASLPKYIITRISKKYKLDLYKAWIIINNSHIIRKLTEILIILLELCPQNQTLLLRLTNLSSQDRTNSTF
ncbi:unnamed protein product [Paramecium octaurelia]|uniref:Transmembrane protein n=1 Tax=Paramecium octaurelia TaxID=43137 RepID=A0A8S1X8S7_PAROT|nr:unnamed protein product [Paramecium octaurelia]